MKKLFLLTTVLVVTSSVVTYAQPRKGNWMVGAKILPITLKGGYFLSDRFLMGLELGPHFSYQPQREETSFDLGASLFARYYFAPKGGMKPGRVYLFGDYNIGGRFHYYKDGITNVSGTRGQLVTGIAPGLAYNFNKWVAVEGALRANYLNDIKASSEYIWVAPELGLKIYPRGKRKKAETE